MTEVSGGTGVRRFTDYPLSPEVLSALTGAGIEIPTPIQEACLPSVIEGKDVVGKAETGTGKTIAFAAPLIGRIETSRVAVQLLVLTPTRELAQQVAGVLEMLGAARGVGVVLIVGGVHASEQILKLRSGSQVVVGTPGRVLDFLRERILSLVWCEMVVLDEADRMLDMGFIDDVSAILDKTPSERQTLLFSATIPPEIERLLHRYMRDPVTFSTSKGLSTVVDIEQFFVETQFPRKFRTLEKILELYPEGTIVIFTNTRRQAIDLDRMLWGHGHSAGALHGDQEQDVRFRILESFRSGDIRILVATDVASRGLDVDDISVVVNYEIPEDAESYVHRIGRTGRAGKRGVAISIVAGKETERWRRIVKATGFPVQRLPGTRAEPAHVGPGERERDRGEGRRGGEDDRGGRRGGRGRGSEGRRSDERAPVGRQQEGERGGRGRPGESTSGHEASRRTRHDPARAPHASTRAREGAEEVFAEGMDSAVEASAAGGEGPPGGESSRPRREGQEGDVESRRRGRRRGGRGERPEGQERRPRAEERRGQSGGTGGRPPARPASAGVRPAAVRAEDLPHDPDFDQAEGQQALQDAELLKSIANRPRAERPTRLKLEEIENDYFKTDYFEIDPDALQRAEARQGVESPPAPTEEGAPAPGQGRRRRQRGGRSREPSQGPSQGRGHRPGAGAHRAKEGSAAGPPREHGHAHRRPEGAGGAQKRRRRGRGSRGGRPRPEGEGPARSGGAPDS